MKPLTSADDPSELLQTDFQSLPLVEVLQKSPNALLGVSDAAATALDAIGAKTIFDLALSRVFDAATQLTDAAENASNALNRFGAPATDMLSAPLPPDTRVPDVRFMPPQILAGIPDANAFGTALGVKTVRDVAFYPPYLAAQQILSKAFFPERDGAFDPESPADLVPKSGQFPTERAQYTVLLLDEIHRSDDAAPLVDLTSSDFRPVDLSPVTAADFGFRTIGTGALLTFNQSWFMQGVTLGHLLHSVALAAGESTRIAVVDWSRKSRAGQTEEIAETEDLLDDTSHNRSISEVTQAVATEAQSGFSHTQTESFTQQAGFSTGSGMAGMIEGFGSAFGSGGSASEGGSSGSADSYASTSGQRNVAASMLQQIGDRTHQHAHAARSRRASVVREVSQSEHEEISTRVVTNYNHMHALTVQYYEVLQLYRTETSVVRADRVVFIPFRLVDFNKDDLLLRFRRALIGAALNSSIVDALTNYDTLELAPDTDVHFPNLGGAIKDVLANPGLFKAAIGGGRIGIMTGPPISGSSTRRAIDAASIDAPPGDAPATVPVTTAPVTLTGVSSNAVQRRIATGLWSNQFVRLANVLGGGIVRGNSPSLFVPSDVKLMDAEVNSTSGQALTPVFYRRDGTQLPDLQGTPVALSDIARVAIRGSNANVDVDASAVLTLIRNGVVFPLELPAVTIPRGSAETRVVQISAAGGDVNLKQHLMDNQLYYSQAVFRTLDAAQIAGLLSGFSMNLNGQVIAVAQAVDPVPLRVVGNYLAFKISADPTADEDWKSFLDRRGIAIGQSKVEFVPLSSGGVFAEAVLGRSNSAEKLDITRFWNWQDSPIPIQPSDIAPITAASRAQSDAAIAPGQLSAPIVNIQPPTTLPDPSASFAATIAAIQNGNMFRDMSGMSEVVKLAQSAIQASSGGATAAGAQASSNYQTAVEGAVEVYKASLPGGGNKNSAADKNPSTQGALINEQDKRKGGSGGGGAASAGGTTSGSSGSSSGSTAGKTGGGSNGAVGGSGTVSSAPKSSSGNPALDVATFGPEGKPTDETIRDTLALDPNSPVPTPAVTNEGVPLQDISSVGLYNLSVRDKEGADPEFIDIDTERQFMGSNLWRPSNTDLKQIVGPERSWSSFGNLLFSLSVMPVGSVKSLSLVGYAPGTTYFSFHYDETFDKQRSEWVPEESFVSAEAPFVSIRMNDLLNATAELTLPGTLPKVQLAEVRKAFAPNGQLRIFNISNSLTRNFLQVIANFFQIQSIAFADAIRVMAEEIGVSDTTPPALLKSYRFGFGFAIGDPPPARTVPRLEDLLNEPSAYTAFPRRG
jgi:hypothetical protein